IIDFIPQIE
nr:RecName: Full=Venom peptide 4; AltName: Full=BaP-4 [Brotheas amazonicus]